MANSYGHQRVAVIACGDRYAVWEAWRTAVKDTLTCAEFKGRPGVLIHGDARGADFIAGKVAGMHGWSVVPMPAQWDKHGKAAGPMRNEKMLHALISLGACGYRIGVLAFHDDVPGSKGTRSMVALARSADVPVMVIGRDGSSYQWEW